MMHLESVVEWTLWSSQKREDLEIRMWWKGEPIECTKEKIHHNHTFDQPRLLRSKA
jgi:hypothetical protein